MKYILYIYFILFITVNIYPQNKNFEKCFIGYIPEGYYVEPFMDLEYYKSPIASSTHLYTSDSGYAKIFITDFFTQDTIKVLYEGIFTPGCYKITWYRDNADSEKAAEGYYFFNILCSKSESKLNTLYSCKLKFRHVYAETLKKEEKPFISEKDNSDILEKESYIRLYIPPKPQYLFVKQFFFELFGVSTSTKFSIPDSAHVKIFVRDFAKTDTVKILYDSILAPDIYELYWDRKDNSGSSVSSGYYDIVFIIEIINHRIWKKTDYMEIKYIFDQKLLILE